MNVSSSPELPERLVLSVTRLCCNTHTAHISTSQEELTAEKRMPL